jgi:alkaline phosphatase D
MKYAYKKQRSILPEFLDKMEVYPIWDDHDFGINDGGGDYKLKKDAKKMFLDFWEIPKNDIRHKREGIYFSDEKIFYDKKFKLIFLDTRYFRSKLIKENDTYIKNDDGTILGKQQWNWFSEELKDDFDFLIVFSSIQILAEDHRFEKWSNFPSEKNKLLDYLHEFKGKTLLVSGDRHRGGIYTKNNLIEITASSLNKPGSFDFESDKYLVGKTFPEENYGTIEISKTATKVNLKSISGELLNSITINH